MAFAGFLGVKWPEEAWELFRVTVLQVQNWRDVMVAQGMARDVNMACPHFPPSWSANWPTVRAK